MGAHARRSVGVYAELALLRRVAAAAVRALELTTEALVTLTNLSEQTNRLTTRVQAVANAAEQLWPEQGPAIAALSAAVSELLVEVLSSATVLAAQAVLPAAAQAKVASEDVQRLEGRVSELATLMRDHGERLDALEPKERTA